VGNLHGARGGLPFIVLEHLHGENLADHLERQKQIPWKQAASWAIGIYEGVAAAHARGIVHRNLKPSNVFLTRSTSEPEAIKVLDFGIAKIESQSPVDKKLTQPEAAIGTPHYMSPEQLLSGADIDARTDVWAMGGVLYELLSRRVPFEGATMLNVSTAILMKHPLPLRTWVSGVSGVPWALERLVRACLEKAREDRIPTIRALQDGLSECLRLEPDIRPDGA
jgi:eukaryotic-like serine/threonine-protein kinase